MRDSADFDDYGVTRRGKKPRRGKFYDAKLRVGNLDSITPASFLEMGDAVVKGGLDAITATLKCG